MSVELALKARFSTAEMLSIQAQLTDNSWLLSRDCQLTGGFAFFMWFQRSQFLLTLGGYHPSFQKLPEYPDVPRLGFRWNLLGVIHIKGESSLALTNTCVMAGARMEVTYGPSWLQLWFTSYSDFLAQWDRFYFKADIGVAVGARFPHPHLLLRLRHHHDERVRRSDAASRRAAAARHRERRSRPDERDRAVRAAAPAKPPLDWPTFTLKYLKGSIPRRFRLAFRSAAACCLRIRRERQSHPAARRSRGSSERNGSFRPRRACRRGLRLRAGRCRFAVESERRGSIRPVR